MRLQRLHFILIWLCFFWTRVYFRFFLVVVFSTRLSSRNISLLFKIHCSVLFYFRFFFFVFTVARLFCVLLAVTIKIVQLKMKCAHMCVCVSERIAGITQQSSTLLLYVCVCVWVRITGDVLRPLKSAANCAASLPLRLFAPTRKMLQNSCGSYWKKESDIEWER